MRMVIVGVGVGDLGVFGALLLVLIVNNFVLDCEALLEPTLHDPNNLSTDVYNMTYLPDSIPKSVSQNIERCRKSSTVCSLAHTQDQLFIGTGFQKCGTGTLAVLLRCINRVVTFPDAKEFHFFDKTLLYNAGITLDMLQKNDSLRKYVRDQYLLQWGPIPQQPLPWIPLEITPMYAVQEDIPYLMMEVLKEIRSKVKLFVIVRNPISRAYSGYFQAQKTRTPSMFGSYVEQELDILDKCYWDGIFVNPKVCPLPSENHAHLRKCVKTYGKGFPWFGRTTDYKLKKTDHDEHGVSYVLYEGLIRRGIYRDQLQNYLCAGWKAENILITTLSQLHTDPKGVLKMIRDNLIEGPSTVSNECFFESQHEQKGSKTQGAIDATVKKRLRNFYRPHNEAFIHLLHSHKFIVNINHVEAELGLTSTAADDNDHVNF
eukprot:m.140136 g.140136  ORF g.140136 m.140136 type:complete len:430 (+) comp27269_c0_seq1:31-1320(+)